MKTKLVLLAAPLVMFAALPLLASCGLQKPLERPGPLWGEEKERYDAEQARIKAEQEAKKSEQPIAASTLPPPPPPAPAPNVGASPIDAPLIP